MKLIANKKYLSLSIWLLAAILCYLAVVNGCGTRREVTQTLLCQIDTVRMFRGSLTVSPDRRHVMYVAADRGVQAQNINLKLESYQENYYYFDGGQHSGPQSVVVDGKAEAKYEGIIDRSLVFSADGNHYAYGAGNGKTRFIVRDGKPLGPCDEIKRPVFSPTGDRLAWGKYKNGKWSMVVDGREGRNFDYIKTPVFSPDGKHVAYVDRTGHKYSVIVDSIPQKQFPVTGIYEIDRITFSPDGKRVAYCYHQSNSGSVVVENVVGPDYAELAYPTFSPDGSHLSYLAGTYKDLVIVTDGRARTYLGLFPELRSLTYSPDGKRIAFVASPRARKMVLISDTTIGPEYDLIGNLTFSPDGQHFGYEVHRDSSDKGWRIIVDGIPGKIYDYICQNSFTFTPDGLHTVFAVKSKEKEFIVFDDKPGPKFNNILTDWHGHVVFDAPDAFHYLSRKGNSVFLVEERIR